MPPDDDLGFSRQVDVGRIRQTRVTEKITANEAERDSLARRFGLVRLSQLDAQLTISRSHGGLFRVSGEFSAVVEQICVVTLEPFVETINEDVELYFREGEEDRGPEGTSDSDVFDDEAFPEPVDGNVIDLGEAVAQQLSLALDPYPRAPEAVMESVAAGDEKDDVPKNPFRTLADKMAADKGDR